MCHHDVTGDEADGEKDGPPSAPTRQSDPLKGKVRDPLPDQALKRAMEWFLLEKVSGYGAQPTQVCRGQTGHYLRQEGRFLCLFELWAIARGNDLLGISKKKHRKGEEAGPDNELANSFVSLAKMHGSIEPQDVVGPDTFYKIQVLKDHSKANTIGKNELIGATRHGFIHVPSCAIACYPVLSGAIRCHHRGCYHDEHHVFQAQGPSAVLGQRIGYDAPSPVWHRRHHWKVAQLFRQQR